jgi:hypothetical protein
LLWSRQFRRKQQARDGDRAGRAVRGVSLGRDECGEATYFYRVKSPAGWRRAWRRIIRAMCVVTVQGHSFRSTNRRVIVERVAQLLRSHWETA